MCSHLHFRLAQSQRSPSQSSHHKHPLCVSLRGTAHTHTQEEEGWREAPPPVHLPPKSSTLTSGPWEEKPTQGLAERAHTHTQLHRALCGPLQLYANSPLPSRSLAAAFALPGENPRTLPRTGARRGRCWPPLSPCLRRNPDGRAGLTYLAAAVGPAGTTGASTGRDEASGRRRQQQHRPGAGLTCWRPEEEQGRFGARSFQPPGGGEARGGRLHLRHAAGREGEREECVPGRLKASVAAG